MREIDCLNCLCKSFHLFVCFITLKISLNISAFTCCNALHIKSSGFPRERIRYVQNLRRNYATYNIINGAFTYCDKDDVQMLMDGDDEFIGKYAFHVMNAGYR